ncbi:MAG: type 4a pilus biogenesis protein PilO [Deltaproteobacteria bacterium]|nr:type 4a pilus biogenesis protein PilO [Deltaproteobacteria bacterium]
MDVRVEKILNLPAYQRILIVVLLMAVLIAGFYFLVYQVQLEEYDSLVQRRNSVQLLVKKNQKIADKLDAYRKEFAKLQEELHKALGELPLKKEIPSLLTSIGALAKAKGLDILRFRPQGEIPKGFYAEVPVELRLSGSYHQAALFFDSVGKMERIVNIQGLKMGGAKQKDGRTVLSISCRAITFRFLEGEAKKPGKGGKRK